MHALPQFVRQHGMDHALAFNPRFSRESRRSNLNIEMRFAAFDIGARMAVMTRGIIVHGKPHGLKSLR